jgi:FkbH-like protein
VDTDELLKEFRRQLKSGDALDCALRIRDAIRRDLLEPLQLDRAGRLLAKYIDHADMSPGRVRILGQCTTSWLVPALTAVAWGDAVALEVVDGEYDNIVQELMSRPDLASETTVLLPWNRSLLKSREQSIDAAISAAMDTWKFIWNLVAERGGSRLIQVGYDCATSGSLGGHLGSESGDVAMIRTMNTVLRAELPPNAIFVDLAEASGQMGRERFYDARRYHWTKQPFSEAGVARLAQHLNAAARAVTSGPRKVLVLDLDNTLWGGVVGEVGALGVELGESPAGEAFVDFQREVSKLARAGIVLAIASKNNHADATEPFEQNPEMVLSLDDIAAFEASWEPKDVMLRRIAARLNLGLEEFVFFDDNPAERELIRQAIPEVSVVDVPNDPSGYVRALQHGLYFASRALTAADLERTSHYQSERGRRDLCESATTLDDYLSSLDMRGDVRSIDTPDLRRVVQLLGKTNQWNLTTRRLSESDVRGILDLDGAIGLSLRLVDRFGDYGLIAVLLATRHDDRLQIIDWLMSCRVIGRTSEQFLFRHLAMLAEQSGIRVIEGEYLRTKKNGMVAQLYLELGFDLVSGSDERATYSLDLASAAPLTTSVRPA